VLTIPVSMGYGVLALQPLGDGYVSHGVVAGLVSAIIVLLAGALLGGSAGLMYTPRSVVTLIMAAVILEGVARGPAAVAAHGDVQRTLTLVFFVVVAAGLFQSLFGALRLGSLIRYIPSPVMAGFHRGMRREHAPAPHHFDIRLDGNRVFAQFELLFEQGKSEKRGVPFVHVIAVRACNADAAQELHSAHPEQDFLAETIALVAAVECVGECAIPF